MRRVTGFESDGGGSGGFTLIEMLIVIAVIAILAGLVLTGVTGFQATARDTRRVADLKNAQNFLELYYNKVGVYPDENSWDDLVDVMGSGSGGQGITDQFPKPNPAQEADYPYYYGTSDDNLSYVLGAKLERGGEKMLGEDIDAATFGVNCTDPVYCIKS
ncbi:MAG: hypothetical protein A2Y84_00370 [Candidatus Colwellbacteria bacterium RBG_13_48_8]|uniref:Type II secretion system protein GspG C-terminal domain-containing protein n=1 Tax=Candidatus Colwellbacteria bacterium RBG_13_48_8 TaxID=1797685 RepID=A0A1G1YXJ8_9BACT|nr:MAG: hypothetical protein A2Y84_00370 [Candidatus Colwellbacteria bacterium RBG_13_48_8]